MAIFPVRHPPTHPPRHLSLERLVSQHILIRYSPYIECRHIGLFGTGVNCHSDICPELQFYFGPPNLHFECGTPSSACFSKLSELKIAQGHHKNMRIKLLFEYFLLQIGLFTCLPKDIYFRFEVFE